VRQNTDSFVSVNTVYILNLVLAELFF